MSQRPFGPPHPATLTRAPAPHPATVVQRRAPHPATLVQREAPHPAARAVVVPARKPTEIQRQVSPLPPHPATIRHERPRPGGAVVAQRSVLEEPKWSDKLPTLKKVRPGIAIQIPKDSPSKEGFVDLIDKLLAVIEETKIGQEMVAELDPDNKSNDFNQVDGGKDGRSGGLYKGITLLICPVNKPKLKSAKMPNPLETGDFFGIDVKDGRRYHPDPDSKADERMRIPQIKFWDVTLGDFDANGRKITKNGIEAHPDLPGNTVWPLDTALFHELCHAYLFQAGISKYAADALEEYFVTGLDKGIGFKFSENTYRGQSGQSPRTSYLDLKIQSPEAAKFDWGANDKPPAEIFKELGLNGTPWLARTTRWK